MNYTKATLKGTLEAVLNDIKGLTWNGEIVYPDYPNDYEKSFAPFERFVVSQPRQEVITPAEFNEEGEETTPAVLGDWVCKLVLPLGYDTSTLNTIV